MIRKKQNKINIVHLVHGAHYGGGEKIVYLLCKLLDKSLFNVNVVVLSKGEFKKQLDMLGIENFLIPMKFKYNCIIIFKLFFLLKSIYKNIGFFIVHTHIPRTNLIGGLATWPFRLPVISTIHAKITTDNITGGPRKSFVFFELLSRRFLTIYIAVSNGVADDLRSKGVNEKMITIINNSVDIPEVIPDKMSFRKLWLCAQDTPLLGMVASFRPRKGAEYLLMAMKSVIKKVKEAKLVLIGNAEWIIGKDYLLELKSLTEKLGIKEHVIFAGFQSDIISAIAALDILVLPSLYDEGLPLCLLEAMSLGKPVIATDVGGNKEVVIHRETGILIPPSDPKSLAEAIVELLDNPQLRIKMGWSGYEYIKKKFSVEEMVRRYEVLYNEINAITNN